MKHQNERQISIAIESMELFTSQRFNYSVDRRPACNSTYPKGGVSCFADCFVGIESSVLRMKFSGKSPALRVAAKR